MKNTKYRVGNSELIDSGNNDSEDQRPDFTRVMGCGWPEVRKAES
jgi:hypothetical protein